MVFQQFNLFANKNILDVTTLAPIKVRHMKKGEAQDEAMELLACGVDRRPVNAFSVLAAQQRVAIARCPCHASESHAVR